MSWLHKFQLPSPQLENVAIIHIENDYMNTLNAQYDSQIQLGIQK